MRRVALGTAVWLAIAVPSASANELVDITLPARHAEVSGKWTQAKSDPLRARVLLPDRYDPKKAYPLLVLLAGASSDYTTWSGTDRGNIVKTAAGFPGIIVMPDGGTGMYADWWNGGKFGDPAWESYYMDEVVPQILERYRIRPERRWHALAGVSMGGLGTAYLGGRLPGFFGSIALISGVTDTHIYPLEGEVQAGLPEAQAGQNLDLQAVYGPTDGYYSYGHDPTMLAENLRQTRVYMASGDGIPTDDGDPANTNLATDQPIEMWLVRPTNDNYATALNAARVPFTYDRHHGIHDFHNFRPELRDAIKWDLFAPVDEHPASWVNDTVATHGKLWEFGYRFDAPPSKIVRFERAGGTLEVSDAGTGVTITTDGGCVIHSSTPAAITVPAKPCVPLKAAVAPRRLHAGRSTRVTIATVPGALVHWGTRSAQADASGLAYARVCASSAKGKKITVTAPGYAPVERTLRASGKRKPC